MIPLASTPVLVNTTLLARGARSTIWGFTHEFPVGDGWVERYTYVATLEGPNGEWVSQTHTSLEAALMECEQMDAQYGPPEGVK